MVRAIVAGLAAAFVAFTAGAHVTADHPCQHRHALLDGGQPVAHLRARNAAAISSSSCRVRARNSISRLAARCQLDPADTPRASPGGTRRGGAARRSNPVRA